MDGLTPRTTHYIVHFTLANPSPSSSYGTSAPYRDLEAAIKSAWYEIGFGRRAFVTARGRGDRILAVIPVVDYPVAQETHIPEHAQDAISRLFDDLDWVI